ncbi:MAG: tetratricopeptide repeat protein [Chloroflexi bacterium]|nr:tetratricopeptide repeat protein [Chloroflexota bacterium]
MAERSAASDNPKYTIPEPRSAVVSRERLKNFLHENVDQPLQLICAPAGYGKTTLLADFARDTDLPVCWYSMDELDRDPNSFVAGLFELLHLRFPALEQHLEGSGLGGDWRSIVGGLVEGVRSQIRDYFILVIDDVHIISDHPTVMDALDLLIQRLPDNCRLILASRELPQLASLPRLISQRRVAGLGAGELKFTADEITRLLKQGFDLDITAEEADRLEKDSEGWITAILLTTHSMWKGLFREVLNNEGQNALLFDYLASEVFTQQPPEMQRFLLATSILNEFDAELAGALTDSDDAGEMLRQIEARNIFVTRLAGEHSWYRSHHLFRDFLRERLTADNATAHLRLHNRAAAHYLTRGDARQAIHHFIQGESYEEALDLLEDEAESLAKEGLWDILGTWLEQIPEEQEEKRPKLLLYLATGYQRKGKNDDAIRLLTQVIEDFQAGGDFVLEAQALMRRSVALRAKGAAQMAVRDAQQALALTMDHGTLKEQADARSHLGRAYGHQGKLPRAERELRQALDGYQQEGDLYQISHTHGMLGFANTELGELTKAMTHFEMAVQGWRQVGNQSELSLTLYNMACLYFQEGRYEEAERTTEEAYVLAVETNSIRNQSYALTTRADIHREQGHYEEALSTYQQALQLARECTEAPVICYCSIGTGETYRLMGDLQSATVVLRESIALAGELDKESDLAVAYTCLGILECDMQRLDEGIALLVRAVEILDRAMQRKDLARARFHLAHALFTTRRYGEAIEQLQSVAQLCESLGQHRFLIEDSKRAALMVQHAAVTKVEGMSFYAGLRDEVNRLSLEESASLEDGEEAQLPSLTAPRIEVRGLGALRISLDGNPILNSAWGSSKAREMFLFLLACNEPVHKGRVVEALWPLISSSKANSNFHSTLYRMRSALYPNCVERDGELYQLNPDWQYSFDLHEFGQLIQDSDELPVGGSEREDTLRSAIALYKGPLLEEFESDWCAQLNIDLGFKFWKAVTALADAHEDRGEVPGSISILERALEVDELEEDIYYKIVELYIDVKNAAAAARTYRKCLSLFGKTIPITASPRLRSFLAEYPK